MHRFRHEDKAQDTTIVLTATKKNNMENKKVAVDKNNKYDRQLRLWGDHGQSALETARVCLINATATGTEILKNLILPGIGSFTVVDGNKVQGEDAGNNFFLTKDSIGQSRAKVATELLSELNDDVSGDFVEEHPEKLLETNKAFFTQFSLVIATNVCERTLLKLASNLWERNIPLLICRCYGFIGYMRLAVKEHTVIESHPDSAHEDLRLDRPFPGLVEYADSLDLDKMDKKAHSHTPWLIVLYKYLQIWKSQHNGEAPKNYREKNQLKDLIREGIRRNEDSVLEEEENFDEAIKSVNTALVPTRIPSAVETLFNDSECVNLHAESSNFWVLVRAVKEFVHNEGKGALPLRGTIPDMTSDSDRYIQLQQVYRQQAERDDAIVTQKVHDLLQSIGRDEPLTPERLKAQCCVSALQKVPNCIPNSVDPDQMASLKKTSDLDLHCLQSQNALPTLYESLFEPMMLLKGCHISEQEVKTFCKNAAFVRLVRCRSLEEEYSNQSTKLPEIAQQLEDEEPNDVVFYVLLRAVDRFYEEYNVYPGYYTQQVESDVNKLKAIVSKMMHDWGLTCSVKDDFVHEMCRYGAAELHSLSAFIGGAAAQEAIKVIVHQFVPFNNTFIYNAMKQTSVTIET